MNEKYTIISGTNRTGSNTEKIARHYQQVLKSQGITPEFITLEGWKSIDKTPEFIQLENDILTPTNKFIFISPEYNGSIPGVLKLMFDISDYKRVWWGKKALLTGVATGRGGNLRGLEHLTSILHYLRVIVHPNKLPISSVDKMLNGDGTIHDAYTVRAIDAQISEFIQF
jgi:chromate reductase, NAD(P)H dehydrogenase (quinone)